MSEFRPRAGQQQALNYVQGKMGISAVPGSGKTATLAHLAAQLVADRIDDGQEVLIVTLVNSAVDNFRRRINALIEQRGLLPNFGYRVRTLHGLAHDIVRERPALVGLADDFGIIDEREATRVRQEVTAAWLRSHDDIVEPFLSADLEENRRDWTRNTKWPELADGICRAVIKRAKDLQLAPEVLQERLRTIPDSPWLHLLRMGADCYLEYQRSLAYRGTVDFDDLIRLALEALQRDGDYLARLQRQWPYLLEDEAQDSSLLQERILRLLAGPGGNWIRVGDPNQAIYDTFTNANPKYLLNFLREPDVAEVALPESGRSQPAIIALANDLVDWTVEQHPTPEMRGQGAFRRLHIVPTLPGDSQPNPPNDPQAIFLDDGPKTPEEELKIVVDSIARWLPDHPDRSVGVLAPRNQRGFEMVDLLKAQKIPYVDLLRSTSSTRATAGAVGNLLRCLADPTSPRKLAVAFEVWRRDDRQDEEAQARVARVAKRIKGCIHVEAYLWPRADRDWLTDLAPSLPQDEAELLEQFRERARRWHLAATMPIDQLVLTLANDLFAQSHELALARKLAILLRNAAEGQPSFRLPELVQELAVIARNERSFLGFDEQDTGFEPPSGHVTVATMHKAKGLEWDRVYLMSINNYDFPSGLPHDSFIAEAWYIRDHLNLEAEVLAYLEALAGGSGLPGGSPLDIPEGQPSQDARMDYVAERLRLLYVGITRARRDLIVTWNTGRRAASGIGPAEPLAALIRRGGAAQSEL